MAGTKAGGMPGLSWFYSVPDKDLKPTLKPDFSVSTSRSVDLAGPGPFAPGRRPKHIGP